MGKKRISKEFLKKIMPEEKRKNRISISSIDETLTLAVANKDFVNNSSKNANNGIKKSQRIYEKLENVSKDQIRDSFLESSLNFLKHLKAFSRNRKFIISFDTTKEAFYGDFSKAKEPLYLHAGSIAKGSEFYYEYLTVSITGNNPQYILDSIIVRRGMNIANWVSKMVEWIKRELPLEVILFDRGFTSKELIYELNKLKVPYIIFWKKQGDWYKPILEELKDGEFKVFKKEDIFYRDKSGYKIHLRFILIKQLEYENKSYDWIFATNLNLNNSESYVKRYKKRWGIETIYRVTDNIRAYTTSTKSIIRYFLFVFTNLIYNIWRFFQTKIGEDFTLSNFRTNTIIFLAKIGRIYPMYYDKFEKIALRYLTLNK